MLYLRDVRVRPAEFRGRADRGWPLEACARDCRSADPGISWRSAGELSSLANPERLRRAYDAIAARREGSLARREGREIPPAARRSVGSNGAALWGNPANAACTTVSEG